jgi:hypothetical protein
MNIIDVITNLIETSKKAHGKDWRYKFDAIYQNYRYRPGSGGELTHFNETFLAPMNLKLVGSGKDRLVFNYKNIIIKFDHKHSVANALELKHYNELNKSPILKYFTCPTFHGVKVDGCNVLITMKAEVSDSDCVYDSMQRAMASVLGTIIYDMFWANRGMFAGGVVAIDLGEGYIKDRIGLAEEFAEKNSKSWKTYTKQYDEHVESFQHQEALCIAS